MFKYIAVASLPFLAGAAAAASPRAAPAAGDSCFVDTSLIGSKFLNFWSPDGLCNTKIGKLFTDDYVTIVRYVTNTDCGVGPHNFYMVDYDDDNGMVYRGIVAVEALNCKKSSSGSGGSAYLQGCPAGLVHSPSQGGKCIKPPNRPPRIMAGFQ